MLMTQSRESFVFKKIVQEKAGIFARRNKRMKGGKKMSEVVAERDKIAELAETEEIKKSRERYQKQNERLYANEDIESLIWTLSGLCGLNIHVGNEADMYFGIMDFQEYVIERYAKLSESEAEKYKRDYEEVMEEAREELEFIKNELL